MLVPDILSGVGDQITHPYTAERWVGLLVLQGRAVHAEARQEATMVGLLVTLMGVRMHTWAPNYSRYL